MGIKRWALSQLPAERPHAVDSGLVESSSLTLEQSTDGSLRASLPSLPPRSCCCCCPTPAANGADDDIESKGATELRTDGRGPTAMVALGLLSEAVTFLSTSAPVVEVVVVVVVIVFEVVVKLVIVVLQPVAAAVDVDAVVVVVDRWRC